MTQLDKNLLPDEKIIFRTKKHLIIFLVPAVWLVVAIFLFCHGDMMMAKIGLVPFFIALVVGASQLLNYYTSEFAVTNKRMLMREGFFFRHANEMRLSTVSNVSVNQSLLGRILNYGTVVIQPFGGNQDVFSEIALPQELQRQTQITLDGLGK